MTRCLRLIPILALLILAACGPKAGPPVAIEPGQLAVAGFTNPQNTWELLAGCLPEKCILVEDEVLNRLDGMLGQTLRAAGKAEFIPPPVVRQCAELAMHQEAGTPRLAALKYWLAVGRCVPADYLLVPQLTFFQDKDIENELPASVTMEFYLLDVRNGSIARRYTFDETQQPLLANLLDFGKFVSRGGKWVSAYELAGEGMRAAVRELGL